MFQHFHLLYVLIAKGKRSNYPIRGNNRNNNNIKEEEEIAMTIKVDSEGWVIAIVKN